MFVNFFQKCLVVALLHDSQVSLSVIGFFVFVLIAYVQKRGMSRLARSLLIDCGSAKWRLGRIGGKLLA